MKLIFTEALTEAPEKENFTITSDDGTPAEFAVTKSSKMGAEIALGANAVTGRYTVALKNVAGAVTDETVKSASFTVIGKGSDVATTPFYLMNEDFNNYTGNVHGTYENAHNRNTNKYGDIPVGWYDGEVDVLASYTGSSQLSDYNQVQNKYGAFWQKNGYMMNATAEHFVTPYERATADYAMKLGGSSNCQCTWGESVRYYFPTGVASGDFVMEFDVMHKGGGWNIGTVGYQSWDSIYAYHGGHTKSKTVADLANGVNTALKNRSDVKILGVGTGSTDLKVSEKISSDAGKLVTAVGTIPEEKWTNVKIEFNTNTGIYNVTIAPEGESVQTYQWNDNARGRFEKGIKGITLNRLAGAESYVCVDNFKIYKTDSYLVNDDFDDYDDAYVLGTNNAMQTYMPGGWYTENHQQVKFFNTDTGTYYEMQQMKLNNYVKAGLDENDEVNSTKTMVMTGGGLGNAAFKAFSRPIGQGVPFVVSFDIKADNNNTWWKLLLPNQAHLNLLSGFNYTGTLADGVTASTHNTAATSWANVQGKCVVLSQYANANCPTGHLTSVLQTAKMNTGHETDLTAVNTKSGAWLNYILEVAPSSDGKATVKVTVTDKTTELAYTSTYTMIPYQDNTNWYMWPAAGIGFISGGGTVSIDNVKVCEGTVKTIENDFEEIVAATIEETDANTASIVSIRAEYMNGETEELTDGAIIRPSTKRIAIEFNDAVAVAEAKDVMQPYNPIKTSRKILDKGLPEGKALSDVMNYGMMEDGTKLENYVGVLDWNGNDTSNRYENKEEKGPFEQLITYDYQRSIMNAPIVDSENHITLNGSKIYGEEITNFIIQAIWEGGLHGRAFTQNWVWERNDSETHGGTEFAGSPSYRPDTLAGIGRKTHDLNRLAYEVVAVQSEPADIGILYSDASGLHTRQFGNVMRWTHAGVLYAGKKVQFVTEDQIEKLKNVKALIVPRTINVKESTVNSVYDFVANGGKVMLIDENSLTLNEYENHMIVQNSNISGLILKL